MAFTTVTLPPAKSYLTDIIKYVMSETLYYFDHAAATPLDERVSDAMRPYQTELFFNPSSPYQPAVRVRHDYEDAKARLARTFGAKGDELVMTAGATESINLAFSWTNGHVVTSAIEHDAVLAAAMNHSHTFVSPTEKGIVTEDSVKNAITTETQLISIQLANNELGTIQSIRAIADVVRGIRQDRLEHGDQTPIYLHCDASQGFGQIDVHVGRLGIDMLSLNAGKMYGPKQVGLLWLRPGVHLAPIIVGGGQEKGLRSGTENVAGVIGFAKAAELAVASKNYESKRIAELRDSIQARLLSEFPEAVISGHQKKRLPSFLHISFPDLDAERLIFMLEERGVMVATGSACAANKGTRSKVLTAIGMNDATADGSLRLTLGKLNDETSCQAAVNILIEEIGREYQRVGAHA